MVLWLFENVIKIKLLIFIYVSPNISDHLSVIIQNVFKIVQLVDFATLETSKVGERSNTSSKKKLLLRRHISWEIITKTVTAIQYTRRYKV